jgi:hemerythrin-like metal-binding protein
MSFALTSEAILYQHALLGQILVLAALAYGALLSFSKLLKHGITSPLHWKSSDFPLPKIPTPPEAVAAAKAIAPCAGDARPSVVFIKDYALQRNGVIDAQHERLFDYSEKLRAAILAGRPAAEVNAIIDALVGDMTRHFRDEEAILSAAAYPDAARHAALHRQLLGDVHTLIAQFRAGSVEASAVFGFMAHEILAKHALEDHEFGAYSAMAA